MRVQVQSGFDRSDLRAGARPDRRSPGRRLEPRLRRTPPAHAGARLQGRALPQRPALPPALRVPADPHPADPGQPSRPRRPGRSSTACRSRPRRDPGDEGRRREAHPGRGRRARHRTGGAGPLHADPLARAVRRRSPDGRSTSTTRSCPGSRAPTPTGRRTRAG